MTHPSVLIMAAGTGGHIFPALAVARILQAEQYQVHWLGTPAGILTGSLVGGFFAGSNWRHAFYLLGVGGLVAAALVMVFIREPSRGFADGARPSLSPPPDFAPS